MLVLYVPHLVLLRLPKPRWSWVPAPHRAREHFSPSPSHLTAITFGFISVPRRVKPLEDWHHSDFSLQCLEETNLQNEYMNKLITHHTHFPVEEIVTESLCALFMLHDKCLREWPAVSCLFTSTSCDLQVSLKRQKQCEWGSTEICVWAKKWVVESHESSLF